MNRAENSPDAQRPAYEQPTIRVMNETEVLEAFQITSAGVTWWG